MRILHLVLKFLRILISKVGLPVVIIVGLGLLFWFGGPYLVISGQKPLATVFVRVAVIVTIIAIVLIYYLVKMFINRKGKGNDKIVGGMVEAEKEAAKNLNESVRKEMETLQQRMIQAHQILRESKFNKNQNIYELPWYIFIGPPGTGKTTAIHHSGLKYPLRKKMGVDMIKGVGGTRNCDWWFTDKAILIDTAGRYVTQDSHVERDGRAWIGFLELLKKWRPQRPINGVIISLGISDLLMGTKKETIEHGRAIKNRLQELQNRLGMSFPVYVLLSKCDLIAGFKEFFSELTKEECEQVWGVTFDGVNDYDSVVEGFNEEFHKLINNVNARVNARLLTERNQSAKQVIYEFPKQLRLLQSKIDGFLKEIFSSNAYEVEPMIRGVYLTSATQEGQAIDQLPSDMLTEPRAVVTYDAEKPVRSYFIKKVLEDVIFPEQNLATTNKYYDKKNAILRNSTLVALVLIFFGFTAAWWNSYNWNKQLIGLTSKSISLYRSETKNGLQIKNNLIQLSNALTILRDMPIGYKKDPSQNKLFRWGLYQASDLKPTSINTYKDALEDYLQPELNSILIGELKSNKHDLSYLYMTLRTYLMLYQPKNFIREDVIAWFSGYFKNHLSDGGDVKIRNDLLDHINSLLNLGLLPNVINASQVKRTRNNLTNLSMSERAYQYLKFNFIRSNIPSFTIHDILDQDSLKAFTFLDKKGADTSIPGLYTYDGFYNLVRKNQDEIINDVIKDGWVYGRESKPLDEDTKKRVTEEFEDRYFKDYIFYWDNFINNITLNEFINDDVARANMGLLSSSKAPMKSIVSTVQKNVNLIKKPDEKKDPNLKDKIVDKLGKNKKLAKAKKGLKKLLSEDESKTVYGQQVNNYFSRLLRLNLKRLDAPNKTLVVLNKQLKKQALELSQPSVFDPTTGETAKKDAPVPINYIRVWYGLSRQTAGMPEPLYGWFGTIRNWLRYKDREAHNLAKAKFRKNLEDRWKNIVIKECNRNIIGRYPFAKSTYEVRIGNLVHFFNYGGTLDAFFNKNLVNFVDTTKRRWRSMNGMTISPAVLAMLQQGDRIRKAYFKEGMQGAHVEFLLRPIYLDGDMLDFKFKMNGQSLIYRHDPIRNIKLLWPGARNPNSTIYSFVPADGTRAIIKKYYGDWGFFHFLDDVEKNSPGVKRNGIVNIVQKGATAKFYLIPISDNNPFWNQSIRKFKCPVNI